MQYFVNVRTALLLFYSTTTSASPSVTGNQSIDHYSPLGLLDDIKAATCSSDFQSPVVLKLRPGSLFTSIRIIVQKPSDLRGFGIYFKVKYLTVLCQTRRNRPYNTNGLIITCYNGPFIVDSVILRWRGKKKICSVEINKELNFALVQSGPALGVTDVRTLLPVDGRKGPTDGCFEGHPKVGNQSWTLTFPMQKIIHEIVIFRRSKAQGYAHMNGFYVQGYTESGTLMFRYNDTGENNNKTVVYILTYVSVALKKIVVSIDDAGEHHYHYLELCEVEAYGVCGPPYEGLYCNQTCSRLSCPYGECIVGMCVGCQKGRDEDGHCRPFYVARIGEDYWLNLLLYFIIIILANVIIIQTVGIMKNRRKVKEKKLSDVVEAPERHESVDHTEIRSSYIT